MRHLFYRMTDPRLPEHVEKDDNRGYRAVQYRCKVLRESGRMPYNWITDATRRGYHVATYTGSADFLRQMAGSYRECLWDQAGTYVEVWVESRSIAGVVQGVCEELAVSLYPCGGFSSITLPYEAAQYINQIHAGRRVCVFYIGDYDKAGVLIDVALERELRKHLSPGVRFGFERLGITKEQIEQFDLPTKPAKAGDRRAKHITESVEAEAMPAKYLRQLLRQRIEELLPPRALMVAKAAEESERDGLRRIAEILDRPGEAA